MSIKIRRVLFQYPPFSQAFLSFTEGIKEKGIVFERVEDKKQGEEGIRNNKYLGFLELKDKKLNIYENDQNSVSSSVIKSVIKSFVERYNLTFEIIKRNPSALTEINKVQNNPYTENENLIITGVDKNIRPVGADYYGITMITLIIMYSIFTGISAIISEENRKTRNRIIISPLSKGEFFIGKLLGAFSVTAFQFLIVILVSSTFLKVNFGAKPHMVFLILLSEMIFAISFGICIGLLFKNEGAIMGSMHTLIPILIFLGGGYVPMELMQGKVLQTMTNISPIKWTNSAIFSVIYSNEYSLMNKAIGINMTLAMIFLFASIIKLRRREVL
ncbi:ABC transporter permease [Hathewaya histolytica]|uniref:ABC-type multidrug transport system, permease component n=2 Tax=Hathewaya histolytica TaxID=1498 RepID=A0A4U9RBI5_HATHI|nr:ABC transporter permease [Hathewaya histolytica]VTQ86040.1 ABC-type multidrug transport system, permease component [Hathewaya histolytica]